MSDVPRVSLRCRSCSHRSTTPLADLLRQLGMLRRTRDTNSELLLALFDSARSRVVCPSCGAAAVDTQLIEADDEVDWPQARTCQGCGAVLAAERVRLFPQAVYCAPCQQSRETAGDDEQQRDFCPKCGGLLRVKTNRRQGITRYAPVCESCGYRG